MTHEIGQTARSAIDVFREQPFMLAMILINVALLGFLYYTAVQYNEERRREQELLYDNRKYVTDTLASCLHVGDLEKLLRNPAFQLPPLPQPSH